MMLLLLLRLLQCFDSFFRFFTHTAWFGELFLQFIGDTSAEINYIFMLAWYMYAYSLIKIYMSVYRCVRVLGEIVKYTHIELLG